MKKLCALALLFELSLLSGCRTKPTKITKLSGPSPEVFYTVEAWEDEGAVSSDFTRVYAHFEHAGKSDKVMFLDGAYLVLKHVYWNGGNDATICISDGRVHSFDKNVSLHARGATYEIRNRLNPDCPA